MLPQHCNTANNCVVVCVGRKSNFDFSKKQITDSTVGLHKLINQFKNG
jgi:hypothetical protein